MVGLGRLSENAAIYTEKVPTQIITKFRRKGSRKPITDNIRHRQLDHHLSQW